MSNLAKIPDELTDEQVVLLADIASTGFSAGGILIIYALIIYPLLGHLLGHTYPRSPTLGAPCPVTIFTLGLLLWTADRLPPNLLIIPLRSFVGSTATIFLGMYEVLGLLIAGLLTAFLVAVRHGGHLIAKPSN